MRLTPRASSRVIAVRKKGMVDRGQVQHGAESEGKMEDEVFIIRSNARVDTWPVSSQKGRSASRMSTT